MKIEKHTTFLKYCSLMILVFFLCSSCAKRPPVAKPGYPKPYKVLGQWYQPVGDAKGFREQGTASWYGPDFHGKRTANGETYDMDSMTAAHKTLPLGTLVRVSNLENNKEVEVRINDRGPFVRGRIIDLSREAAKRIGMMGSGTARVEIVAIGQAIRPGTGRVVPVDFSSGNFTFQVGAFIDKNNAERLKARLAGKYPNAHIVTYDRGDKIFYRVRVGQTKNLNQAAEYEKMLQKDGYTEVFTVAE
ncbi:MAG: septal ring lytic transglycosylase RlpA family lipoprotein [Deltaproteobacteria bacterium HGW-Deltaproteobacteria-1]|jgi:rare lipoprotein A|nr:MAG: septal ring lytic transglycosylase RlpA family lipoprotein [Deltaproteobacteria bacterium HGW-Deltaproteobacteria-1]